MTYRFPLTAIKKNSSIDVEIIRLKTHVKNLEMDRISAMLKNLKDDEIRLTKCIEEVEVFHRNMFVLSNTENKTADANIKFTMNDDKKPVTEQDFSKNQLECSVVDIDDLMNPPESFIVKTDNSVNQIECSVVGINDFMNPPECFIAKTYNPVNQPDCSVEFPEEIFEKVDSPETESDDSDDELKDSKNKSYVAQDKSDDNKGISFKDQKELVNKATLDLMADGEREVTKLLLHLIFKFSGFQRSLQEAETSVFRFKLSFNQSFEKIDSILNRLSWCVLYLDKCVSKIYTKYFEMLKNISLK